MTGSEIPFYPKNDKRNGIMANLLMVSDTLGWREETKCLKLMSSTASMDQLDASVQLQKYAEWCGLKIQFSLLNFCKLKNMRLPVIALLNRDTMVVVYKISDRSIVIANPDIGLIKLTEEEYINQWIKLDIPTAGSKANMPGVIYLVARNDKDARSMIH